MNHLICDFVSFLSLIIFAGIQRPSKLKKAVNSQKSLVHSAGFYMHQEKEEKYFTANWKCPKLWYFHEEGLCLIHNADH